MRARHQALAAVVAWLLIQSAEVQAAPTLDQTIALASGQVRGSARDGQGVLAFRGIPYAAPPVGELRWRPPQAVRPWTTVLDASRFGASCLATGVQPSPGNSEDCLTLNVWTPAVSQEAKLPVMVWIPGGGFQSSASSRPNADGARLAGKGIVVVSLNYRVGVYGFLAHPGLDRPGSPSGDFGLQDQVAALKWVQQNIGRFGGDPRQVTIAGESAGGVSVALLMTSPAAHGLFNKAIAESHGFWDAVHGSIQTHDEALARGKALADRLTHGDIEALRSLPADTLSGETAVPGGRADFVSEGFSPNVDKVFLPDAPAAVFAKGAQAHIPLLAGFNDVPQK